MTATALAFLLTRVPALAAVGLILFAAARRWRDDRAAAGLLAAAAGVLVLSHLGEVPVPDPDPRFGWAPLFRHVRVFDASADGAAAHLLLAAACACGLAAAVRRGPADGGTP